MVLSTVLAVGLAAPVAAQTSSTSTTMPPVRSIPVTPAPTVTTAPPATTTTVPARTAPAGTESAAPPMADTGLAADKLVPFGFLLIGLGAALTGGARRVGRVRYDFL